MAGVTITVSGTFQKALAVSPDMPWASRLLVYSAASLTDLGAVRNLGTIGEGRVEGTPTVANGRLLSDGYLSRVVFGTETPDSEGNVLPVFEGGYAIGAVTKNLQAGGFGGMVLRDPSDNEGNVSGRYLVADFPEEGEDSDTVAVGLKTANATDMRIRTSLQAGIEVAVISTYAASGCSEMTGFKTIWMTPDGNYFIQDEQSESLGSQCSFDSDEVFRKNYVEWGSNANEEVFCESSQFAFWGTFLTNADLINAARAMLGIKA